MVKRSVSLIMAILIFVSVFSVFAFAKTDGPELRFNENGEFRILHITDTHFTDFPFEESIAFIEKVLDDYNPDLVILGGDNIKGWFDTSMQLGTKAAIDQLVAPMVKRNIPFSYIYGNHDQEAYLCPKSMQNGFYNAYDNCIAPNGFSSFTRTGNGNILIKSSDGENNRFNIWLFDSGTKTKTGTTHVESVNESQIKWYVSTSEKIAKSNNGVKVPSLVFQHFPVQEVVKLFDRADSGYEIGNERYTLKQGLTDGLKDGRTGVENTRMTTHFNKSVETPTENSGEYKAFVDQGDVIGMFFGHAHVNDYCGITEDNIIMGSTLSAGGFNIASRFEDAAGNKVEARGVRIIDINEKALEDPEVDNTEAVSTFSVYYTDYFTGSIEKYPSKYKDRDEHDFSEWIQIEFGYFLNFLKSFFTFKF